MADPSVEDIAGKLVNLLEARRAPASAPTEREKRAAAPASSMAPGIYFGLPLADYLAASAGAVQAALVAFLADEWQGV